MVSPARPLLALVVGDPAGIGPWGYVARRLPVPDLHPAHGSAYDIAGKGIANLGASKAAVLLAAHAAAMKH